jgi:SAM-dependent methyltransferase
MMEQRLAEDVRHGVWSTLPRNADPGELEPGALSSTDCARTAGLADLSTVLASPDSRSPLSARLDHLVSDDGGEKFKFSGTSPILFPRRALDLSNDGRLQVDFAQGTNDAFAQYLYLNIVKNASWPVNSAATDVWFKRHLYRTKKLAEGATGLVLDVGCDDVELSRRLFPAGVTYAGLEPNMEVRDAFRIIGLAEFLPITDESLDGIAFLTSLDHVFDCHAGIDEAKRVLKPGGCIYLASLVWTHNAQLYNDSIHFHHFRDFELAGMLRGLDIEQIDCYPWKDNPHRFSVYLRARKPQDLAAKAE